MIEELRKLMEIRLTESPGMVALVISDLEGVPILQAQTDNSTSAEICMRFQFTSTQIAANDKCSSLGLEGHKKSLICYHDHQVLTVSYETVVLTLVATADANVGVMENFAKKIQPLVSDVATTTISQS